MEQQQKEQALEDFQVAAQMLADGKSETEIKDELVQRGLPESTAWSVINMLDDEVRKQKKAKGGKNMLFGGLWFGGGLIATMASDGQVLFYGAIIAGAIQFFTGLAQSLSND